MKNKALGKGLSALLKESVYPVKVQEITSQVSVDLIYPNERQPRKHFDDNKIQELANSIALHGILQPIIVQKDHTENYRIVAGERRYRAAKIAKLKMMPVIIKDFNARETFEVALIENIQRDELTAIEEAQGYQELIDHYSYTQSDIASVVGKSRSHIANLLRLNQLPKSVKHMIGNGSLSMGHARCLVGRKDAEQIAHKILEHDLSVRRTEELVSGKRTISEIVKSPKTLAKPITIRQQEDEELVILGKSLSQMLGMKVIVENFTQGGRISIHYNSPEDLDTILTKLN